VPFPAARVSLFGFAAGSTDRTDAAAIKRLIATRPAVPRCDRIVGQPGVPACVAHVNRSVDVYLRGRRGLDIELGRHHRDLTPAEPPMRSLISWHGTSERCARTRTASVYVAARRWCHGPALPSYRSLNGNNPRVDRPRAFGVDRRYRRCFWRT
jgi:hypothetical protein